MRDLSWVPEDLNIPAYEVLRIICSIEERLFEAQKTRRNVWVSPQNWKNFVDLSIERIKDSMIDSERCPKIDFDKVSTGG